MSGAMEAQRVVEALWKQEEGQIGEREEDCRQLLPEHAKKPTYAKCRLALPVVNQSIRHPLIAMLRCIRAQAVIRGRLTDIFFGKSGRGAKKLWLKIEPPN